MTSSNRNVASLTVDSQIHAFAEIAQLEKRIDAIGGLVARQKRQCLEGGAMMLPGLVSQAADMRWQVRQMWSQMTKLEQHLGIKVGGGGALQAPSSTEPSKAAGGLRGTSESVPIPDLVHLLSGLKKTGSLSIQDDESIHLVEFIEGAIVHAVTNRRLPELRLGAILVAQQKLTQAQLDECLASMLDGSEILGARLLRTGMITEADLRAALESQVFHLFEHLFSLKNARFSFADGSISNVSQRVHMNTTQLLLETARRLDESTEQLAVAAAAANALETTSLASTMKALTVLDAIDLPGGGVSPPKPSAVATAEN